MATPKEFPRANWDPDLRAELYKQEFYATAAWAKGQDSMVPRWTKSTPQELDALRELKRTERSKHVGKIVLEQQSLVLIGYWTDLLRIGPTSATTELLHAMCSLGGSIATHFKARYNRVRPWVLEPDLFPPIPSPGLPSYPSGHATQMYLMANLLGELVPSMKDELKQIAERVAVNREIAGLNFESDTKAGKDLADGIFDILTNGKDCKRFQSKFTKAKGEPWIGRGLPTAGLLT